jgi:hypothetical protein
MMIETEYFRHSPRAARYADELKQLRAGVPWLIERGLWDLLSQAEICLAVCGRSDPRALDALRQAQQADGSWAQEGHDQRQNAHTTAAALLALAPADNFL